ncbi:hypothetical protein GCM10009796_01090 [Microbacterium koreense]
MSHLPPLVAAQDLERAGYRGPLDVARYTVRPTPRRDRRNIGTTLTPSPATVGSRDARHQDMRVRRIPATDDDVS